MARPGLMRHRKFARLARLLGSPVAARGHLELLWDAAYEAGDAVLGDAGDVEYLAGWTGDPGKLVAALVESGFVDIDEAGQHLVHDLWDHAPDYVRKRQSREAERRTKGEGLESMSGRRPDADRSPTGQCPPNGRPRTPSPAPAPTLTTAAVAAGDADVRQFWEVLQANRSAIPGLHPESNIPAKFADFCAEVLGAYPEQTAERLSYAHRAFLRDKAFGPKNWGTDVFMKPKVYQRRMPAPPPPKQQAAAGQEGGFAWTPTTP